MHFCVFWIQISRTTRKKLVHSTFNIQHSTFNIQHSTFNIQHSTFNIQHSTFNIQQGKKLVTGMDVNIDDEIGDDE
ncbi:putative regulator PrlF [Shigella sonnei]|nr:AbrB family transcriptional regulator [Shigella sonnei]SRH91886.1 putative regulator PrlF [Shigella sonnei]SRJ86805.1 putative regulator PrlF [Shigella sonnei]SRQ34415.1 putative regulator PrlF [Shigella sonnei]SRT53379.1 putative regulator PrlF [Shigella sonnei]